ncbi:amidohydrolase family protein [Maribellus mangrovi]|uniref:amidohydrolase family protein n=1 Tax=Maribellus mangrovi TaxID=3133146 RepID=UPI0030EF4C17
MKKDVLFTLFLLFVFLLSSLLLNCSQKRTVVSDLAIVHTSIIDATGSQAQSDMTVLINGNTITDIVPSKSVKIDSKSKIVDGKGKFLIPGLWDMHVHISNDSIFFPLMIANGVTSVRDMFSNRKNFPTKLEWRNQINTQKLIGPNLYIPIAVFGPLQRWNGIKVKSKEGVIAVVQEIRESGADFIKVFDLYDPDIYFTLLSEAQKNGIHVAGHAPMSININEAAQAGQRSFEHLLGVLLASSSKEESIRKAMYAKADSVHDSFSDLAHLLYFIHPGEILDSYDTAKANQLMEQLKNSGCYICPTLSLWNGQLKVINSELIQNENIKYVPAQYLNGWSTFASNGFTAHILPSEYDLFKRFINKRFEMVNEINQYGIPFLAGTDVSWWNHNIMPGFSLHEELSLLVNAGLTPMQALQAATRNAAEALNVLNKTGTIEVGKNADLVLLDVNPLEDINNTRKINAVIKAGQYISREELDKLLKEVEIKIHESQ